jgi:chromate transporter
MIFSIFWAFIKIGIFGFGGGMAMLPLIYQGMSGLDLMTTKEFADLVAISQITPGPIAVNAATYVGYQELGIKGALVATLGVSIPAFLLVNLVFEFIKRFRESHLVKGLLKGITPATVAFILVAALIMAKATMFSLGTLKIVPVIMCIASLILLEKFKVSPLSVLFIMGVLGVLLCG